MTYTKAHELFVFLRYICSFSFWCENKTHFTYKTIDNIPPLPDVDRRLAGLCA